MRRLFPSTYCSTSSNRSRALFIFGYTHGQRGNIKKHSAVLARMEKKSHIIITLPERHGPRTWSRQSTRPAHHG